MNDTGYEGRELEAKKLLNLKFYELLALALEDLEHLSKDSRYFINMNRWHATPHSYWKHPKTPLELETDQKCHVCLAGAVLARSLAFPIDINYESPNYFKGEKGHTERLLETIEYLRIGDTGNALFVKKPSFRYIGSFLSSSNDMFEPIHSAPLYVRKNPLKYLSIYREYIKYLKERGL